MFHCTACKNTSEKFVPKCPKCGKFQTYERGGAKKTMLQSGEAVKLDQISLEDNHRIQTGTREFDRVLGDSKNLGMVQGSIVLLGGEPGQGKSTLLLQVGCELAEAEIDPCKVLYISGEETPKQVRERAERIMMIDDKAVPLTKMWFMASQMLDEIEKRVLDIDPDVLIIDSLQTMKLPGDAGAMGQMENCTRFLQHLTKARGLTTFIVSHVNKEGGLAGPKQVEHLVDVVLSFDSERGSEIRTLRALKNRFGNTEEVGIFRMTADGLKSVDNPAEFLIRGKEGVAGSCLAALMLKPGGQGPGKRAVLFETQALLAPAAGKSGARVSQGYDPKRLNMLLAILAAHTPYTDLGSFDVYVNVTPADLAVEESSLDLPVALALVSSRIGKAIPKDVVAWGEMGLTGEIRPNDYGALTRKLGIVKIMKLTMPMYSTREAILSIDDALSIFPEPEPPPKRADTDAEIKKVLAEIEAATS